MSTAGAAVPRLRLRVSAAAEARLRSGHPWLFADSIRDQNRDGRLGELAVIYDRRDQFLAIGLFDPDSPIRARILHAGKPVTLDGDWWRGRLEQAIRRRDGLFDEQTNGYRLINGESDGWPGLVLDRYDATFVVKLYTAAWLPWLNVLPASRRQMKHQTEPPPATEVGLDLTTLLGDALARIQHRRGACEREEPGPADDEQICRQAAGSTLVLRLSRNIQERARQFGLADGQFLFSSVAAFVRTRLTSEFPTPADSSRALTSAATIPFLESGLRFEADVVRGQKTGFFLDQRENRRRVESLAGGRDMLNGFSFSGGFSLYAARGGAKSVTDLDLSAHALDSARSNFARNRHVPAVAACRYEGVQADVFEWLARPADRQFDLIILDPPSLAKRETERAGAINAYRKLNADGLRWLRRGGILVAASCSAHVNAEEFFGAILAAARNSGRVFREVGTTRHPPDHPATFPEAEYLKAIYLQFEP